MKLKFFFIYSCLFCVNMLFAQEAPPSPTDNSNWISSISYDISGQTLHKSVGFFNNLGKATQNQTWDVISGKVWGNEVLYDFHGRTSFSTLTAPLNSTGLFTYDSNFLKENSGNYDVLDFDQGSFIENPKIVSTSSKLGAYYTNNTTNEYQDNTSYPFSRTIHSKLNPGAVKKVVGANKIEGDWLQTYVFSMPAGQELSKSRAFNNPNYEDIITTKTVSRDAHGIENVVFTDNDGNVLASARSGNEEGINNYTTNNRIIIKDQGWVDFHVPQGCQNIALLDTSISTNTTTTTTSGGGSGGSSDCFSNADGTINLDDDINDCIGARIQEYESKNVNSKKSIKDKKEEFADSFERIEISYDNLPEGLYYRVYDLITEEVIMQVNPGVYTATNGFYRAELRYGITHTFPAPWSGTYHVSYSLDDNPSLFDLENREYGVSHCQNYYDYALNYYDKTGRLTKSTQPKSSNLKSEFSYNSLGQLLETKSPDEGEAKFIYRKDGQIRFSQNIKQDSNDEFSYTNYDRLGRPIESGVYKSDDIEFYLAPETPVDPVTPDPPTISTITLAFSEYIQVISGQQSLSATYKKVLAPDGWNAGFHSVETIDENGNLSFKPQIGQVQLGDYDVVIGLSPIDAALDLGYQTIKHGINLKNVGGVSAIQIYENGDFVSDGNNQIISFGTFTPLDSFMVEREDGTVTYKKNGTVFYTSTGNSSGPLSVDASFNYNNNAINAVFITETPALPPVPIGIDIQTLVDVQDGLDDRNCFEQHFTLYDMPDKSLADYLNKCGLSEKEYKQTFLSGNVSKTQTKSPETTTTWYSYDVYGRVTWIIQHIPGLDCLKTIDYTYDAITGQVIQVDYQRHSKDERFIHNYEYNVGGQLIRVATSINNENFEEQAKYFYNETGQLIRKELAENLQGVDYVYNLNGQLKAINHPSLQTKNDPGQDGANGFIADVFGMTLQYYRNDYTRTNTPTPIAQVNASSPNQFNGNIQAIQWQNQTGQPSTYSYSYNKNNWLTNANYRNENAGNAEDYQVSNITYDANGNIKTLKRNGFTDANGTNAMDEFTYHYGSINNQLNQVEDTNDNTNINRYNDLKNQSPDNYIYNSIGQLVINKQDKVLYAYNAAGLVTKISELSTTSTNNYHTLSFEDFNTAGRHSNWMVSEGLRHVSIANQSDQEDVFTGLLPQIINGEPISHEEVNIPPYCVDFDNSDPYQGRLQFNFYNKVQPNNTYTIKTDFKTVANAHHKLEFDVLLFQKQLLGSVFNDGIISDQVIDMNAGATITLQQEDGSIIETIVINPQDHTHGYCDRIVDHINFDFLATGVKVYVTIDITNDGEIPNGFGIVNAFNKLYQSAEIDNVHLQVANKEKVAFYYNDRGQRVRKESFIGSELLQTIYVRDVAGNPMAIYYRPGRSQMKLEEHPVYGAGRIGVFKRDNGSRSGGNYVYQLADHLGNVRAVVMKDGDNALSLASKTDYYPFGMPMPNKNIEGDYRYGYQGEFAEKDPETGKEAFELRLWDSRIGRWLTTDPMQEFASPYLGMGNNPIRLTDPNGGHTEDYYLNLKTGKVEWYEGSQDLSSFGLINVGGDNANIGTINDNISELGIKKTGINTYDTQKAYSKFVVDIFRGLASEMSTTFTGFDFVNLDNPWNLLHLNKFSKGKNLLNFSKKLPMGVPSLKKAKFDWKHIFDSHSDWGKIANQSNKKTIFAGLDESQIKDVVKNAYSNITKHSQMVHEITKTKMIGQYKSWTVEFIVNRQSKIIETAYPIIKN
ncbi:RHS repeat domain-containing protein [Aquimarina sp. 2201CG14-23]|uniref:RHS repeat domain-containing protein n=1 Tax=Aquimarina mycalae TaxID=3040073 RepID=UPI0024780781|nr:RHS repeat-associated core domain-containing protein [Aquimarina sp. 2201CG14-23]MDH7445718.1 RHS repeat-associated core domain-containing protein [Aquimarina sp. 2201CG14-23]